MTWRCSDESVRMTGMLEWMSRGVAVAVLAVCAGCTVKKQEPVVQPTKEISLTNQSETVAAEEVRPAGTEQTVTADFNLDGLKDMAVIQTSSNHVAEVAIYVKRPEKDLGATSAAARYFKVGMIRRGADERIVGIASRQRGEYADLVLLVARENQRNEMIQYRNDGTKFEEVPQGMKP